MSRNRRFRPSRGLAGVVGALALAGTLGLTGCGAGQIAQTANDQTAVSGVSGQAGQILLRDTRISYPAKPAAPGALYQRGGAAPVEGTLINQGAVADRLIRISSPSATTVNVVGDASLPPNVPLIASIGEVPPPSGTRPLRIQLAGLTTPVQAGVPVPVTFTFERAGSVTLEVPIGSPPENAGKPDRQDSEAEGATVAPAEPAVPQQPGANPGGSS